MYNMYHGHAPSYMCDLLPPLVRDDTNYPVRNRNVAEGTFYLSVIV